MNGLTIAKWKKGPHWWPAGETSGRPYGLSLMVGWQYVKAAGLLLLSALALNFHKPDQAPDQLLAFILSAVAIYQAVIGWFLWRLNKWARRAVLVTTGYALARWFRSLLFGVIVFGGAKDWTPLERKAATLAICVDALLFVYLLPLGDTFDQGLTRPDPAHLRPSSGTAMLLDQAYAHVLEEFGRKKYEFWENVRLRSPVTFPHPDDLKRQIEIAAVWDNLEEQGFGGPIRVHVSVLHAPRYGAKLPGKSFLVRPDGTVVPSERR